MSEISAIFKDMLRVSMVSPHQQLKVFFQFTHTYTSKCLLQFATRSTPIEENVHEHFGYMGYCSLLISVAHRQSVTSRKGGWDWGFPVNLFPICPPQYQQTVVHLCGSPQNEFLETRCKNQDKNCNT